MKALKEAIKKVKNESKTKFDATVEVHINLDIDIEKQTVRFPITLPHGTGKTQKVAVLASKKIENADLNLKETDLSKIEKNEMKPKADFDVLKIAKVAKVLGPIGLMPNPKNGTVTENVEKAVEQIKKGKIEIKTEKEAPLIHVVIGKVSFSQKDLEENLNALIKTLKQNRPQKTNPDWIKSIYLTSTMGPSVKLSLEN